MLLQPGHQLFISTSTSLSLSGFSPTFGIAGTSVSISGSNFSTTLANNVVKFNGVTASVTNATSSVLTVTAPSGVTTGTISVAVNGSTLTSSNNFVVSPWTSVVGVTNDAYRISCPNADTCFALNQATSSSNTFFLKTTNGGTNWTNADTGYSVLQTISSLSGGLSCPDTSTCYFAGAKSFSNKILKITNASSSTPSISQIGNTGFYYAISCPTSTFCIATGINSVQRTTDGSTWSSISTSYSMGSIYCIDTNTCYGSEVNTKTIYKTTNAKYCNSYLDNPNCLKRHFY